MQKDGFGNNFHDRKQFGTLVRRRTDAGPEVHNKKSTQFCGQQKKHRYRIRELYFRNIAEICTTTTEDDGSITKANTSQYEA